MSASPITSFQLWVDGVKKIDTGSLNLPASYRPSINWNVRLNKEGWHRYVFIAKDGIGEFRKTAYYFNTGAQPCYASTNKEIKICNDLKDGANVISPVHIAFATKDPSVGYVQTLPGNGEGDAANVSNGVNVAGAGTAFVTGTIHLRPGQHRIRLYANGAGDVEWEKVITLNVIE
jgi:hypothetical protein